MHKIQMSVYDFYTMRETIYEANVSSIQEFIALSYMFKRFDRRLKYKKSTDKNWYTLKSMIKRLFKKELWELQNIEIRHITVNNLELILDDKEIHYTNDQELIF